MTTKWLTPEQAIVKAKLTVTSETLKSYISEQQGKTTAEEQFQALGLLFDRERLRAGKPNFLQLLEPVSDANSYAEDEIDSHELDDDDIETSAINQGNQLEPFIFEQCKVQIVSPLPSLWSKKNLSKLLNKRHKLGFELYFLTLWLELSILSESLVQQGLLFFSLERMMKERLPQWVLTGQWMEKLNISKMVWLATTFTF
ncbi:hypothetical protein [Nostoc sp.]|uniref:hypothetical protein n=1 Tax=Nostoc sp. TaxID=1180 RepID=UPI002FF752ED